MQLGLTIAVAVAVASCSKDDPTNRTSSVARSTSRQQAARRSVGRHPAAGREHQARREERREASRRSIRRRRARAVGVRREGRRHHDRAAEQPQARDQGLRRGRTASGFSVTYNASPNATHEQFSERARDKPRVRAGRRGPQQDDPVAARRSRSRSSTATRSTRSTIPTRSGSSSATSCSTTSSTCSRRHAKDQTELGNAVIGATMFSFFHEAGHGLIHLLDLRGGRTRGGLGRPARDADPDRGWRDRRRAWRCPARTGSSSSRRPSTRRRSGTSTASTASASTTSCV